MSNQGRTRATALALFAGTLLVVAASFSATPAQAQQQVGHKIVGTLGLQSGSQGPAGLYVVDQFVDYHADGLRDANGRQIPLGLTLDALSNALALAGTARWPGIDTYFSAAVAVPVARISASVQTPSLSLERSGLGNLYVEPLKLGWRKRRVDVVLGYGMYIPTASFDPEGSTGVGRSQWTHELSGGGTLYLGQAREWQLSALASYDLNGQKQGIDITRGATVDIQGGIGRTVSRLLNVGVAGYALWEVSDDEGSQVPAALRGVRERTYGLGPEVDVNLPPVLGRLTLRYERDFATVARPQGGILTVGWTAAIWGGG